MKICNYRNEFSNDRMWSLVKWLLVVALSIFRRNIECYIECMQFENSKLSIENNERIPYNLNAIRSSNGGYFSKLGWNFKIC